MGISDSMAFAAALFLVQRSVVILSRNILKLLATANASQIAESSGQRGRDPQELRFVHSFSLVGESIIPKKEYSFQAMLSQVTLLNFWHRFLMAGCRLLKCDFKSRGYRTNRGPISHLYIGGYQDWAYSYARNDFAASVSSC